MDRRKTLGGLSPGHLNSRASLAPGRIVKDAGKGQTNSSKLGLERALARMSLAGPVMRRSSQYTTKVPGVKTDPRPLGDKRFQQECIQTILNFLALHSCDYPITHKALASPTVKDFTNIMGFLMRFVDPAASKTTKAEEEVPALYKRLRYPFQISKSNLTAVNSPHTWPSILAAIAWLVELLNYSDKADECRDEAVDERQQAEADFFSYVSEAYKLFMAGDDDACETIDARKAAEIEDRAQIIRNDIESLQSSNEALRAEVEQLRSRPSPLLAARSAVEETQNDKAKFVALLDNLKSHKSTLQRKLVERRSDISTQQQELEAVLARNDALRGRVASQTVHPGDVVRMNQEMSQQEGALRALLSQREAAEAKALEASSAVEGRMDSLECALQGYHAAANRLRLIPATAKRAEGINFECRIHRIPGTADVVSVDLKGTIRPALERLRDQYATRARELDEEALSLRDQRDSGLEALTEREEDCAAAQAQVGKLEGQHKAGKDALDAAVSAAAVRVESLAGEADRLRNAHNQDVEASEERLRALHAEHEDMQRVCELENATMHRDLAIALEAVLNHKVAVQGKLKGLEARLVDIIHEVASIPLPTV